MKNPTEFQTMVYEACSLVPMGRVTTYKAIAKKIGTRGYRAVGLALNKNPFAPRVPCHRVVSSDGNIGGFASGCENKIKILQREGVLVKDNKIIDFEKKFHRL